MKTKDLSDSDDDDNGGDGDDDEDDDDDDDDAYCRARTFSSSTWLAKGHGLRRTGVGMAVRCGKLGCGRIGGLVALWCVVNVHWGLTGEGAMLFPNVWDPDE